MLDFCLLCLIFHWRDIWKVALKLGAKCWACLLFLTVCLAAAMFPLLHQFYVLGWARLFKRAAILEAPVNVRSMWLAWNSCWRGKPVGVLGYFMHKAALHFSTLIHDSQAVDMPCNKGMILMYELSYGHGYHCCNTQKRTESEWKSAAERPVLALCKTEWCRSATEWKKRVNDSRVSGCPWREELKGEPAERRKKAESVSPAAEFLSSWSCDWAHESGEGWAGPQVATPLSHPSLHRHRNPSTGSGEIDRLDVTFVFITFL